MSTISSDKQSSEVKVEQNEAVQFQLVAQKKDKWIAPPWLMVLLDSQFNNHALGGSLSLTRCSLKPNYEPAIDTNSNSDFDKFISQLTFHNLSWLFSGFSNMIAIYVLDRGIGGLVIAGGSLYRYLTYIYGLI
ncbi:uncharacterized protein L201_002402 [Kwoniella dendrophila CBS 6074]|uniref:Uncharacterized protein n=1 Tax=Kwoniella dendrophila CBS 6074 TaxID=1295534 RepID=A0AAX4JQ69_9TREE